MGNMLPEIIESSGFVRKVEVNLYVKNGHIPTQTGDPHVDIVRVLLELRD
jgi:hypothetical protein